MDKNKHHIVFLTGAGISQESGISTFRDANGLWNNHKMPNTLGHAKDFYNPNLKDNERNSDRNLLQFSNPSNTKPKINDILIFDANSFNPYGHVAIVSKVTDDVIEIIQQNPGRFGNSRETIDLKQVNNKWKLDNASILGWLRKN